MKFEFNVKNIGQISDGSHTFDELYYHRMMLFAVICNTYKDAAWKSWKHEDGTMYDDYFIVGITTPDGDYSYHYHKDHWDMFNVRELAKAPKYDGHQPKDVDRLLSLVPGSAMKIKKPKMK
jgi:hypothetical protein